MANINHPVIGDGKYGNYQVNKEFKAKYQMLTSYSLKIVDNELGELNYLNNKLFKLDYTPYIDLFREE